MKIFEFLVLIEVIIARQIFGRGGQSVARSKYTPSSSKRKLNVGSANFAGFNRPDTLTTAAPKTVKAQGLSLSPSNKRLPSFKQLDIESKGIKESDGNRFNGRPSMGSAHPRAHPSSVIPKQPPGSGSSLNSSKSKFVNGGSKNPEVKVQGNMSFGPGLGFLSAAVNGESRPIERKRFQPSTSSVGSSAQTPPRRYGAGDASSSAKSVASGGFNHNFGGSNSFSPAPSAQASGFGTNPTINSGFSDHNSHRNSQGSGNHHNSQGSVSQAPGYAQFSQSNQNSFTSPPSQGQSFSNIDRFASFNSQPQLQASDFQQPPQTASSGIYFYIIIFQLCIKDNLTMLCHQESVARQNYHNGKETRTGESRHHNHHLLRALAHP